MPELPESLYIVRKISGECLFSHQFETASYDASLVSAFLGVINQLGDQVLGRESALSVIDQGSSIIILEHGREIFVAVKTKTEGTIRSKLRILVNSFEEQFSEELQKLLFS